MQPLVTLGFTRAYEESNTRAISVWCQTNVFSSERQPTETVFPPRSAKEPEMMPSPHNIRREARTKRSEHLEANGGLKQCFCAILCSQHPTGTDEAEKVIDDAFPVVRAGRCM